MLLFKSLMFLEILTTKKVVEQKHLFLLGFLQIHLLFLGDELVPCQAMKLVGLEVSHGLVPSTAFAPTTQRTVVALSHRLIGLESIRAAVS